MTMKKVMENRERGVTARVHMSCSVVLLVALAMAGCGAAQADAADDATAAEATVRVINVETWTVIPQEFVEDIRLTSAVLANQDVLVAAEESGVIREIFLDKGRRAIAGDPIAKIDDRVLSFDVAQARARAEFASQTWERRKRLWEEDQVGSEIAYLEAKFGDEQAAATLAGLEQRLARTVIRAPFSGIFDERHIEVGSMVSPGQSVGRLVDLDPVKVVAGVPERYATDVVVGAQAMLTFDVLGGQVFTAPISYVGSTVDPQNRTFMIELVLPNPDRLIKPQMVANMSVTRRQVADAIVVPQDALVRVEEGYVVFVVSEGNGGTVADVRPVELGPTRRNLVVIEAGVVPGDQLIVVGQRTVSDGDRVNVVGRRD
jgi:membrane fusion protein (multidrug efflux system)